MKRRIIITADKNNNFTISTMGKFTASEIADVLAGAYAGTLVEAMKEFNMSAQQLGDLAIYALRKNIEERRKGEQE